MRMVSCVCTCVGYVWVWMVLWSLLIFQTTSQTLVESLPGYPGLLPFKLETGYIGVGEDEVVQLFYYFVESERDSEEDPLLFWLDGGPGASSLYAFFYEIGPLQIEYGKYVDDVPLLKLHPTPWTKFANVVYLDAPTRTGFSYTKIPNIVSSDTSSASQSAEFIRKFVKGHPKFLNNPLYVTGMSYSGIVVPIVTETLYEGNDAGLKPTLNIKGYTIGSPMTNERVDINSRFEYAYHMGLIPYEIFEYARKNCEEEYADADPNNSLCLISIEEVNKRISRINKAQVLEPDCMDSNTSLINGVGAKSMIRMLRARTSINVVHCREGQYGPAVSWANNKKVMKALNIREGTITEWYLHNYDMSFSYDGMMPAYEFDVRNSVNYHASLTKRECRGLIYSGDHDLTIPHIGTRKWIHSLNLSIYNDWEAWYVNDQVAGYKTIYALGNYSLVHATVKGAGHTAPEYKPEECFQMAKRWFAYDLI